MSGAAPKGVIIGAPKKDPAPQMPPAQKSTAVEAELFPARFAMLTAVIVLLCIGTLAVLLDVSDSLRTQSLKARLASATTSINKLFITDLVQDTVSFDSRVSIVASQ